MSASRSALYFRTRSASVLPDPPEPMLRKFAFEWNQKNPDGPRLSAQNPADREQLKRKFYDAHPDMLRRMQSPDRPRGDRKPPKPS